MTDPYTQERIAYLSAYSPPANPVPQDRTIEYVEVVQWEAIRKGLSGNEYITGTMPAEYLYRVAAHYAGEGYSIRWWKGA